MLMTLSASCAIKQYCYAKKYIQSYSVPSSDEKFKLLCFLSKKISQYVESILKNMYVSFYAS